MIIKYNKKSKKLDDLLEKYKSQQQAKKIIKEKLIEIFLKECHVAMNDKKLRQDNKFAIILKK